ncbi:MULTISPECIES: type II toxin-antitoxin system CcdA family antitoxin [Leclercia]|uniref:type II toxin-antitoxin system CcdA family antitoxin n=1 Tax=Leclercia TaxID=83654 RepID=UPI0012E270C3|nr:MULTISPECIES: type II toxin-antitoxin system CcdA family antitoxin [Leclercia]QGU13623.1 antitoxin [Leclercia sp. 119287]
MTRTALKRAVTLTVDPALYDEVKQSGANMSAILNNALLEEQKRLQGERWKEENREGIQALNRFLEENGSFSDQVRRF